ncbi:MAG: RNA polymerase sigma-70 factor [Prolixibacteraceae bacterium]|nr:RNA polymerase sigma-70 factor [Prolixibacteraceae bacterium]
MSEGKNDRELIKLLQKGNVEAFDSLFEVYSSKLFGFAVKYFKNEADAEELVQEVFVKVWENRQTLKSELSFKSYLFTIALNQIRKYFNKKAASLRYLETIQNNPEFSEDLSTDEYESALSRIYQIINQMPVRRLEIFTKSKLEGKNAKEVAAELNISPGTVDNQVSEALRFIRSQLKTENLTLLLFAFLFVF